MPCLNKSVIDERHQHHSPQAQQAFGPLGPSAHGAIMSSPTSSRSNQHHRSHLACCRAKLCHRLLSCTMKMSRPSAHLLPFQKPTSAHLVPYPPFNLSKSAPSKGQHRKGARFPPINPIKRSSRTPPERTALEYPSFFSRPWP
jgi:hypothetical protein